MRRVDRERAEQAAKARRTLEALLRTPKTRRGLIAAVSTKGITKHFVFGFLSDQVRSGRVVVLKTGATDMYQLSSCFSVEVPARDTGLPQWLMPTLLPPVSGSRVFINGKPAAEQEEEDNEFEQPEADC